MEEKYLEKQHVTFEEAQSAIQKMNMVNNFLFDRIMENKERAKKVAGIIISTVLGYEVSVDDVESQKVFGGIDKGNHGIRLDAYISEKMDNNIPSPATVYDLEMEDREADRRDLPKRFRYYTSLIDSKVHNKNDSYDKLPDLVSITILSYDPFLAGDMYYEAKTVLTTHPNIEYNEGRVAIFLYAGGNYNFPDKYSNGKIIEELIKFIVSGEMSGTPDNCVSELNGIVEDVKKEAEVTKIYMQKWDRELTHDRELTEKVTTEIREEDTIDYIKSLRKHGIADDVIRKDITEKGWFSDDKIDELFKKADRGVIEAYLQN